MREIDYFFLSKGDMPLIQFQEKGIFTEKKLKEKIRKTLKDEAITQDTIIILDVIIAGEWLTVTAKSTYKWINTRGYQHHITFETGKEFLD